MAVIMLLAIVFRSLPDSVFNYFHNHTHIGYAEHSTQDRTVVKDYQHNCHIQDWNYETFDLVDNCLKTIPKRGIQPNYLAQVEASAPSFISQIGRGPPCI